MSCRKSVENLSKDGVKQELSCSWVAMAHAWHLPRLGILPLGARSYALHPSCIKLSWCSDH